MVDLGGFVVVSANDAKVAEMMMRLKENIEASPPLKRMSYLEYLKHMYILIY